MTGNEVMSVIRQRASDIDKLNLTDSEILENINTVIRYLSLVLIAKRSPVMIASEEMADYTTLPPGFHSFVGAHPAYTEGNLIRLYDPTTTFAVRYFQSMPQINALTAVLPFEDIYKDAIVEGALMLCLNKDEFDVSFENALYEKIAGLLP
ncbi:MAG: hypothetical protein EOM40_19080 [Clostridia bacterium]|nr:hypothetical protein [Clostridia bacterium]